MIRLTTLLSLAVTVVFGTQQEAEAAATHTVSPAIRCGLKSDWELARVYKELETKGRFPFSQALCRFRRAYSIDASGETVNLPYLTPFKLIS
ncbi:hypothetical protein ABMB67_000296 [Halalkalibacter oceani]